MIFFILLGICFIETKNLDGETNLKQKSACQILSKMTYNEVIIKNLIIF